MRGRKIEHGLRNGASTRRCVGESFGGNLEQRVCGRLSHEIVAMVACCKQSRCGRSGVGPELPKRSCRLETNPVSARCKSIGQRGNCSRRIHVNFTQGKCRTYGQTGLHVVKETDERGDGWTRIRPQITDPMHRRIACEGVLVGESSHERCEGFRTEIREGVDDGSCSAGATRVRPVDDFRQFSYCSLSLCSQSSQRHGRLKGTSLRLIDQLPAVCRVHGSRLVEYGPRHLLEDVIITKADPFDQPGDGVRAHVTNGVVSLGSGLLGNRRVVVRQPVPQLATLVRRLIALRTAQNHTDHHTCNEKAQQQKNNLADCFRHGRRVAARIKKGNEKPMAGVDFCGTSTRSLHLSTPHQPTPT